MRTRAVFVGLALLALAALAAWLVEGIEKVPVTERVPASGEARLRPFLAAERLAERMGMASRELRSLAELDAPAAYAVLLVPNHRPSIDAKRAARLLAWVQDGGHLVVEAEPARMPDPLLDAAGVRRERDQRRGIVLRAEGEPRFRDGERLLTVARGKGLVTAATSLEFARNSAIGKDDHAALLWRVLTLSHATTLQVFFRPERLSLWRFLVDNALPALLGAFALLGLWLWRIAPRFGPVAADPPPARRRLLDHLRASGRYLWTEGLRAPLALAARDAALRRLARAQPDFALASAADKAARLAALAGVSIDEAQRFIAGHAPRGADFIRLAAIARRVHLALEKGTR